MDIATLLLIAIPLSLLVALTIRNRRHLGQQLTHVFSRISSLFSPSRREAMLNYVVCTHCRVGKSIINPVYRMTEGVQYIAGTCSACGKYICAPLR
jgi:hypothetical protein